MGKAFDRSTATVPAGVSINVAALLAAEGYLGSMAGVFLEIDPQLLTDLYRGDASTVDASNGRRMTSIFNRSAPPVVDPSRFWLFSATGGDIGLTFEPL